MGGKFVAALITGSLIVTASAASFGAEAARALKFSNARTPTHDAIRKLMEAEGGSPIDAEYVSLAEIDLDFDGTPEIFAFADASWRPAKTLARSLAL